VDKTYRELAKLTGVAHGTIGNVMIEHKDLPETERRQHARIACIWKGYETLKGVQMFDN